MAAEIRDGSMLHAQLRRQGHQEFESRIRSPRQPHNIAQPLQRRQGDNASPRTGNGSQPDSVPVATIVLTETVETPFGTLTTILTVAPTPAPERNPLPTSDSRGNDINSPSLGGVDNRLATMSSAQSPSNTAQPKTSTGSAATSARITSETTETSPTSTASSQTGSSGSTGIQSNVLIPAIVGGAVFLIIVAFLLGYCIRRRKRHSKDDSDPEAVNEIDRGEDETDDGYGAGGSPIMGSRPNEKQPVQRSSIDVAPDINIDSSLARNRSLSKGTSQSREGLLQSDHAKLATHAMYNSEREKRQALAMFRRSTAQDSATIPLHLRNLRPESVSTDGFRNSGLPYRMSDEGEPPTPTFLRPTNNNNNGERISKIGMALSTSDKSVQDDNISAIIEQGETMQGVSTMFFEETPPIYSMASSPPTKKYLGGTGHQSKPSSSRPSDQPVEFNPVGSSNFNDRSRFVGRSDIATPSPPGSPTRSSHHDRDTSTSSRRSSRRGSGIFGLASATASSEGRRMRPKSWDRKSRRYDRRRQSRGRGMGVPTGLEKTKGSKSRSRSRGNAMWTAWFDSSSEGEEEGGGGHDVIEPISMPGGIVTAKSQRKKRVIFNSTSDISENQTASSARTLTNY
ncbi:hypothetical protein DRE_01881 [Drechslerella stenobrocha 248]|uniref:Uncharacterized protein n=1 Tax=Drechslerella stenobrocha 248 TaxID=1043628 RepID=W7HYS8_9PEZI|nr:hypothetical protein DRE_01881 [Drechslerella stenobrocha 248]